MIEDYVESYEHPSDMMLPRAFREGVMALRWRGLMREVMQKSLAQVIEECA